MRLSPPLEPMLARSVTALPPAGGRTAVFEPKVDGYRTIVFARPVPYLQSRRGTDLTGAFPEIARAAAALGTEAVLDAELVVENAGLLDFAALQQRARRRGATAEHAARTQPAHLVVFDLLEVAGTVLMQEPLRRRRAALEELFAARRLSAPWTLCPQTADPGAARAWLDPVGSLVSPEGQAGRLRHGLRRPPTGARPPALRRPGHPGCPHRRGACREGNDRWSRRRGMDRSRGPLHVRTRGGTTSPQLTFSHNPR
ncbi:ATP-dependent DNA ligase [Streptomyces sp. NPDC002920]